jgi:DNA cross-link repair 1A protein
MASQVEAIKWVPGTRLLVDGFRFARGAGAAACLLTHAHSDHTVGLTHRYEGPPIYCSAVTARLVAEELGVPRCVLRVLPLDVATPIPGSGGVEVVPIDANHCPGAVMFLFKVPAGGAAAATGGAAAAGRDAAEAAAAPAAAGGAPPRRATSVLHTGDVRWCAERHARHPALAPLAGRLDVCMLDTTYCGPRWAFPPQAEAIAAMAAYMRAEAAAHPDTLFLCAAYHIGKERAYFGAAAALGWRVWAPPAKRATLRRLALPPAWAALLEDDPARAELHVGGGGAALRPAALAARLAGTRWRRVVALRPSGWCWRGTAAAARGELLSVRVLSETATIVGVPYSEHSSFPELRACVAALRPRRLVPTVNAGDAAAARAQVDRLCAGMDLSRDRSRLDAYFDLPARRRGGAAAALDAPPLVPAPALDAGAPPLAPPPIASGAPAQDAPTAVASPASPAERAA